MFLVVGIGARLEDVVEARHATAVFRRAVVLAGIWPAYVPPCVPMSVDAMPYTTPYLAIMEAIAHFGMCEGRQEKKDSLVEWFLAKQVGGEPVSRNRADAMARLIRLPSAQRGGAKRMDGPDLRKAL